MKLKHGIHLILITGMMSLAACSSMHKSKNAYGTSGAYGAQSSGIGQESSFGDEANGQRHASSRVYYFAFDSDAIRDADKPAIQANANYLVSHNNAQILLAGHTDPRGSREYNIGLGERRAKAVARLLMSEGVNPKQIRVVSYGAEKLASPGRTEADFQLDRRVVLSYTRR
jgi:peptidoglycan-associated lipoprotein